MQDGAQMLKKNWNKMVLFLIVSVLLELVVFNYKAVFSLNATNQQLEYVRIDDTFYSDSMTGEPGYLYVGVECYTEDGTAVPATLKLQIHDAGNVEYYELGEVSLYPSVEKSKYIRIYSYGDVHALAIEVKPASEANVEISELRFDAKVPWFVSFPRMLLVFVVMCLAWILRPASALYTRQWTVWQKRLAVGGLILANCMLFFLLVRSNPAFLNPTWPYHQQYHQLAVALSEGEVSIDVASAETMAALAEMENPYDMVLRSQLVPSWDAVWDIAYYEGNLYVYFGIVPVLLFYLPFYLVFHSAFPTWLGVFIAGSGVVVGVYYLFRQICKRWFPNISFALYLILSVIASNSLNLFFAMLHADFYYLPIVLALCFTLWGIGLFLSAVGRWENGEKGAVLRIALGALCMALTAGCRPQFLVGSFLLLPVLLPAFWKKKKEKGTIGCAVAFVLPYVIVAVGLMYYNYIRFGSVFDFGANYNLTTNDMTRRGFNLGRLPDGIIMYLLQPFSLELTFPFVQITSFYTNYLGETIKDWTYGGAFWVHPIFLILFCVNMVKKELKEKKAYGFTLLSMFLALVVVCADTEMAGILHRYCTDFWWLLMIPTVIILLQLVEKYRETKFFKMILLFLLFAGVFGMLFEVGATLRGSGIINDNAHRYYMLMSLFQ